MADVTITAANARFSLPAVANARMFTAGEALTRVQPVYLNPADNKVYKADANASLTTATVIGVAMQDVGADQVVGVIAYDSACTPGFTLTKGVIYVASATPGGIAPAADVVSGWFLTTLLVPISTTQAILQITNSGVAT